MHPCFTTKLRLALGGWGGTRPMEAASDNSYKSEEGNMPHPISATSKGMARSSGAGTESTPSTASFSQHLRGNPSPTSTVVSQPITILSHLYIPPHFLVLACCAYTYGPRQPFPDIHLSRSSDNEKLAPLK